MSKKGIIILLAVIVAMFAGCGTLCAVLVVSTENATEEKMGTEGGRYLLFRDCFQTNSQLGAMIKPMLMDPDSYEYAKTVFPDRQSYKDRQWNNIVVIFRARNSFGGMVEGMAQIEAYLSTDGRCRYRNTQLL